MSDEPMPRVPARWTDDCRGKKDFDGHIISLSTRYWPRGGALSSFSREFGWQQNDARPQVRPSATAKILLHIGPVSEEHDADDKVLARQEFEGESLEEVQAQVQAWAQDQYERIVRALQSLTSNA